MLMMMIIRFCQFTGVGSSTEKGVRRELKVRETGEQGTVGGRFWPSCPPPPPTHTYGWPKLLNSIQPREGLIIFQRLRTNSFKLRYETGIFPQANSISNWFTFFLSIYLFIHTFTFWQHKVHSTHWSHKGLSRNCFAFVFVFLLLLLQISPTSPHRSIPIQCSTWVFLCQRRWNCYMRHLPHRPNCHTSVNTTHNCYHFTGLFCRRFIRDIEPCIVTTQVYFNKRYEGQKKKNIARLICHKRTIFHTGLLHTFGHTSLYKALTSRKGETKREHVFFPLW